MTKQSFWELLESCRNNDINIFYHALKAKIKTLSPEELRDFNGYLNSYMQLSVECVWLDMLCKVINGYVSDDSALYFTLWVISQGEKWLLESLKNPDALVELPEIPFGNAEFEMLMGIGFDEAAFTLEAFDEADFEDMDFEGDFGMPISKDDIAVQQKCLAEIEADITYKNGDKYGGYTSFEAAMEDIPQILPNLIKRAEAEGFDWQNYI